MKHFLTVERWRMDVDQCAWFVRGRLGEVELGQLRPGSLTLFTRDQNSAWCNVYGERVLLLALLRQLGVDVPPC